MKEKHTRPVEADVDYLLTIEERIDELEEEGPFLNKFQRRRLAELRLLRAEEMDRLHNSHNSLMNPGEKVV